MPPESTSVVACSALPLGQQERVLSKSGAVLGARQGIGLPSMFLRKEAGMVWGKGFIHGRQLQAHNYYL